MPAPLPPDDVVARLVPELGHLFDESLLTSHERASLQSRLDEARRYLRRLLHAYQGFRWPSALAPPRGGDAPMDETLIELVASELKADSRPELKRSVARRMSDAIWRHYLWSNLSSLPVFYELTVLGPWLLVDRGRNPLGARLAELACREMLNGIVLNLAQVRTEILGCEEVYLAECACRDSGVVDDLMMDGRVFTLLGAGDNRRLLDRLLDRFESLGSDRLAATTDPGFRALLADFSARRRAGAPDCTIEEWLRATWPAWEILPVRRGYTTRRVRSLQNNHKCFPVDKLLVYELLNIWYFSRGAIFNSMKAVDSPYTICTCPTPENQGGCVLTNWYYYGRVNHSLVPGEGPGVRRRDEHGRVLACRYFPVRARRACVGCGCDFSSPAPRDLDASLAAADAMLARPSLP